MKRDKMKHGLRALLVLMVIVLVGTVPAWSAQAPSKVTFVSGTVGGSWYNSAALMAQIMMKEIPGLNVTATSGISLGNVRLIDGGVDAQLGWTYLDLLFKGVEGAAPFKEKHPKACVVIPGFLGAPYFVATKKSGIKDWADMKNKRILTPPLAGSNELIARKILELYGITYQSIKAAGGAVNHIEFSQGVDLVKDNRADAVMVPGQPYTPVPLVLDLENTMDLVFPTIRKDILDKFCQQNRGYIPYPLPAGLYKDLKKPVMIAAGITLIITNRDLPDEFVYKITKSIYENRKQLQDLDKAYNYINKDNLTRGIPDDMFHPGALKFIKEVQGRK
jgi:TRAP transporter TAXI family solute receptor